MAKKKARAVWTWAPNRRIKPKVLDDSKAEVQGKADELIEKVLKPRHIKPPPKKPKWNYPIALWTKWHGSFFYFGSTWACPSPNRIAPTFDVGFARLEYVGDRRFNLAYFRHTEEWWTLHKGLTLAECLELIEEGGLYSLP